MHVQYEFLMCPFYLNESCREERERERKTSIHFLFFVMGTDGILME